MENIEDKDIQEESNERSLAKGDSPDFKWYLAHVLSGYEGRVTKTLKERVLSHGMAASFSEIVVPEEEVVTQSGSKKRTIKKKLCPGYVFIKMIMSDEAWHLVKNTDKITGFLGGQKSKPEPIPEHEALAMLGRGDHTLKRLSSGSMFSEGDSVKVIEGPFASFVGTVEQVTDRKLKVQVSIFGRPTPVELDFSQVEKVKY